MTYEATPEQWADAGAFASDTRACILELLSRVEALEKKFDVQLMQLSDLQSRFHQLTIELHHLENELVKDEDEYQQHPVEALEP